MTEGSVTEWIAQLRAGDVSALSHVHRRYWPYLTRLADRKLKGAPRRAADEEDVAQEALLGFYQSVRQGGFPELSNRHDLLAVLALITARRAASQLQHNMRQKRGGGLVRGESVLDAMSPDLRGIEQLADDYPTPQEQVMLADCYEQFIAKLPVKLRPFAELYLAGHSYREIATALGCAQRTVERKIPLVLRHWQAIGRQSFESTS